MIQCLSYVLNETEVKLKNTDFVDEMLHINQFLNARIWIVRLFYTQSQLLKFRRRYDYNVFSHWLRLFWGIRTPPPTPPPPPPPHTTRKFLILHNPTISSIRWSPLSYSVGGSEKANYSIFRRNRRQCENTGCANLFPVWQLLINRANSAFLVFNVLSCSESPIDVKSEMDR